MNAARILCRYGGEAVQDGDYVVCAVCRKILVRAARGGAAVPMEIINGEDGSVTIRPKRKG
jgi:hypothetical protein